MSKKNSVYIGLGSNVGNGLQTLKRAWNVICKHPEVKGVLLSSPYKTAPVGMASDNWFTNAVGLLETTLESLEVLKMLLEIELDFGRRRSPEANGYEDRTLDLDILIYNDMISDDPKLLLPHPEMQERLFVLRPFAEIAPDVIHPLEGKSIIELEKILVQLLSEEVGQQVVQEKWPTESVTAQEE